MAPATDPIPSLILDNIETVLAEINGGSTYFYSVAQVQVPGFLDVTVQTTPAIIIIPGSTNDDDVEVYGLQTTRWNLDIIGVLRERSDDRARDLLRFLHDIYKALLTDPTRGGYAIDTKWLGWNPELPADSSDLTAWISCAIQVHFRTDDADMTTAR